MTVTPLTLVDDATADEELRQRVCLYLDHTGHYRTRSLDVQAQEGKVTLRGKVPTYYVRQVAIACAQRVAGVRSVVDRIEIELPAEPRIANPLRQRPK